MGALCSGKSDNPHQQEPNRPQIKVNAGSDIKTSYSLEAKGGLSAPLEKPASGLFLDEKSTKNI